MNIVPVVKLAAGLVTSLGAGAVVGNAIKATTPAGMKIASKVLVGIGGVALSTVAGELAATYVEKMIQTAADSFRIGKKIGYETAAEGKSFKEAVEDLLNGAGDAASDLQ